MIEEIKTKIEFEKENIIITQEVKEQQESREVLK